MSQKKENPAVYSHTLREDKALYVEGMENRLELSQLMSAQALEEVVELETRVHDLEADQACMASDAEKLFAIMDKQAQFLAMLKERVRRLERYMELMEEYVGVPSPMPYEELD